MTIQSLYCLFMSQNLIACFFGGSIFLTVFMNMAEVSNGILRLFDQRYKSLSK